MVCPTFPKVEAAHLVVKESSCSSKVGDVLIWDNRRVLHRRDALPDHLRRLMKRCQVLARESWETL
jgi:hypothetical protein